MIDVTLEDAWMLKQAVINFVFDAEGKIAESLEAYAADRARAQKGSIPYGLIVDAFLVEGRVDGELPLEFFLKEHPNLSENDQHLLSLWQRTFTGLFAIERVLPEGFELMNWLTAKHYVAQTADDKTRTDLQRMKPGEIILTRISPVTDTTWMISPPYLLFGKLGKPKLAVAIGNFRENHKRSLYSDAPELLEEAWQSVEKYHQAFLDFFGGDEVSLPGHQLSQKMMEFQEVLTKRQLAEAGIDESKSLADIVAETGMSQEEMAHAAEEAGVDAAKVKEALTQPGSSFPTKMIAPQIQLPDQIKRAEQVTVLAHPRWGQTLLPDHAKLASVLTAENWRLVEGSEKLVHQYLQDSSINLFVWQRLAEQYPENLEVIIREMLNRPDFQLQMLPDLLREYGKPLEPDLPEIASVPLHLHQLFEEAVIEVNKSKPKGKDKSKSKKIGFGSQQ